MPELRRHDTPRAADATDRDSRIEALLVDGLDRYFSGQFDEAINIWTRALFLDRSHARARAYIDRARTALAERQRRADEMLQRTEDLLAEGRTQAALALLMEAAAMTGDDERVSALRLRLERSDRATAAARIGTGRPRIVDARPVVATPWSQRVWVIACAVVAAVALVAVVTSGSSPGSAWLGLGGGAEPRFGPNANPVTLQPLSTADAALVRARTLYRRGRLSEALLALDRVQPDSPQRAAADRLRNEMQQILLAGGPGIARLTAPAEVRRP